ncbi:homoserine kinase [Hydrogenimonas thermophila]|uniref:Homoserine kinase n=1 Tax=Hydrogenimonas thermophila TaxID=223786 RepID=A0A1I5LTE3_9BACT|nr:homoserine kinase [Hydrogenimonas thermophila]WOE70420.1 homoserine kinase [Hydrogenimonas thermophila]WOE72935.1 homoserine kinase [Hydrogenimonas thermophila]SFP00624.1 homoserine kinase [Hydrogenimonas thermophila]
MIISVPATSANLGPGFDSLGLSLSLRNRVHIQPSKFFSVSIKGEGANNPRLKGNNLFINIFNDHYTHLTGKRGVFRFRFYNQIPLSRGLGSSSAVIVSAIASAYSAAGVNISRRKLLNLALHYEHHPDNITPAVMGGFNVSVVENNKVYSQRKRIPGYLKAVVVIPDKPISTAHSRTTLPRSYRKDDAIYNLSHSSLLTACFFNESWEMLRIAARDKFHQVARMKNLPELFDVQKLAIENNVLMSTLSGSGSTFFNMVYKEDAKPLLEKFQARFPSFRCAIFDFDNDGVLFRD